MLIDKVRITQVINNLTNNALKSTTGDSDSVDVETALFSSHHEMIIIMVGC